MTFDLSKHKEAYLSEARVHLKNMNRALLDLEKIPSEQSFFHEVFRSIHTLKSLAATMRYNETMSLCHAMEDLLGTIREGKVSIEQSADLLFACFDQLAKNIKNVEENIEELDSKDLIKQLQELLTKKNSSSSPKKISNQLDTLSEVNGSEKVQTIEVKIERLNVLMNLAEEMLVSKMKLDSIRDEIAHQELTTVVESLSRLITDLQYYVIQVRLVPIAFIFNRFPRMVRDIAKQQKKQVNLKMEGGDIELDRMLVDEIGGVITHIVRNAIDHGIETPSVRKKANKPPTGTITLRGSRTKEMVVIEITDDGAGLDLQSIKSLAVKQNIIKSNATNYEIQEAIFTGLSTTKTVTLVSGRGLGLSIVKKKIESIGGTIHVESLPGQSTSFFIEIPLTLAIIKTLFVKVAEEIYAIPMDLIERLLVANESDFKGLLNYEAIIFEGTNIPIVRLSELFNNQSSSAKKQSIVIIRKGEERLGLAVDGLLSSQEVIIKPLTKAIKNNKYFSGAALIGSGKMVLILDASYLLRVKKTLHPVS